MHSRRKFLSLAGAALGAAALPSRTWAMAQPLGSTALGYGERGSAPKMPLLLGVDYYPDQTPESLWEEDARMMGTSALRMCA